MSTQQVESLFVDYAHLLCKEGRQILPIRVRVVMLKM